MSDKLNVVSVNATSYVTGKTAISPKGVAGWDATTTNFRPYVLPGQDYVEKTNKIETPEFVIAKGQPPAGYSPLVTSNKWWSPALLQHKGRADEAGWIIDGNNPTRRSMPMVSEPFRIDFVDMTTNYAPDLAPIGVRLWNQSDMYVYTGDDKVGVGDNKFSIDNLAQVDAPIVTVGLHGVHPLANPPDGALSNVVVNNHTVFHVEMAYAGNGSALNIQAASGVPYIVLKRTGNAPFQLWAGSPVTDVGPSDNKDTYDTFATKSTSELGFKLGMRFLPALPQGAVQPNPPPRGRAGYYVRADRGEWVKQPAKYGTQSYFTWINKDATMVWLFAIPHNVNLDDAGAVQAAIDTVMAVPAKEFDSDLLYSPEYTGEISVNGQVCRTGYDQANSKITVGYRWTPLQRYGEPDVVLYLALFPHHRKYMRENDAQCFPKDGNNRPLYFYRTLKGEMWLYKGREFVREMDVHGLLPFLDHWSLWQGGVFNEVYMAMRTWFWTQEPVQGNASPDSFAWNYFENGGPEANPYMYGWAGIYESLIVADQLAAHNDAKDIDLDFKTPKFRVAEAMRNKILDIMKQLFDQWFDVYSAQCLQYNDKFLTMCGYPEGYFCVSHLCDHHFHWGYFLHAAAAVGRHDPEWLNRHWPTLDLLIRDSANYDRRDGRFPRFRNFSPFYGHFWANGIALNNGQDQESTSEAINFASGMVELATLRGDADMLAVGLYLYEEQVCTAEQYWFNVDADLDNDPKDPNAYYNGNWPKGFVRFKRGSETWNTTLIGILGQQSISRQTHFGGLQGTYTIHMTPVGTCNVYLERHPDWFSRTYKSYLQTIHTLPPAQQNTLPYENVVAMWQAVLPKGSDGGLQPFERPGPDGAKLRIGRPHIKYPGALNAQALAWMFIRTICLQADSSLRSNAVHYGVFATRVDGPNERRLLVYNPSSKDLPGIKFWDRKTGNLVADFGTCPARTLSVKTQDIGTGKFVGFVTYTPSVYKAPAGRLYLRRGGKLDLQPGAVQQPNGEKPYPMDLSDNDLQNSVVKLGYGETNQVVQFSGSFSGKLDPDFQYTQFSLFTNAGLWPGWTRDQIHNIGAGVEVKIEYDFGGGRKRTELYGPTSKFNLQTNNTWLNHNALTEFATTTVPVKRDPKQNPLKPEVTGVEFASVPQVTQGSVKVTIWGALTSQMKPDIYLSCDCALASQRGSWIGVPYQ